ncbi:HEAT repeat domain-containing protein [Hyalangium rubrum]|uniref:HEAT repeat domain-containing protein n=1 Tax=Hyalangium rubrum TaxID=3103134 RepID=A0ABU5HA34_9BACT|nr:HEAT repeat domain-containing protein [Hyalangium sp. s54d21]MDY7230330.1 HEAT repeat domain-containing protein [Hyalangium sp. s54d21]
MSGNRAWLLGVPLVVVLLGLGGWWATTDQGKPEDPSLAPAPALQPAARPESQTGTAATKAPASTRAWRPGSLYRYAVSSDQDITLRQPQSATPAMPGMRFQLKGEWDVGLISAQEERIEARVHLRLASFSASVEGQQRLAPEVERALSLSLATPFFITLDRTGAVKFVHFERELDGLAQGLLRSMVASTQFVMAGAPRASWEATEFDSTGQYLAAYRLLAPARVEKTKRHYTHMATPQGLAPLDPSVQIQVRSLSTIELAEDLWIRSLEGAETLVVNMGEGMPEASTTHQVSLRLLDRLEDASLLGAMSARQASLVTQALASLVGQAPDPMEHYRQVLGNRRFEDMVQDLRSLPQDEKARDDARTAALERLRALFMLQPTEALKVSDILRSGIDPIAASPMLGALSAASTPEAVQVLSRTIEDTTLSQPVRTDAVAALGMAEAPTQEGVDTLWRTAQGATPELRETATLALGNAAMNLQDEDTGRAGTLVEKLSAAYRSATSPEQQALVLRALGNTHSASAIPLILEGARSTSAQVRAAAAVALRFYPDPSMDRLLSELLVTDSAPEVRKSVVFACSFRALMPLLPALQRALQSDPADTVRAEIVVLLGRNRAAVPQAEALLTWSSQHDRSADIRQAALSFLQPSARPLPPAP